MLSFARVSMILAGFCGLTLGATCIGPITLPDINQDPIADAGENQIVCVGQRVDLTGLASADPDGDTLSYIWTRTLAPAPDDLESRLIPEPSFTPTAAGTYEFSLTVTDDRGGSDSDTVRVVAVAPDQCDRCQSGQCCLDTDCDDGLFCNGVESCDGGVCRSGADPCGAEESCDEGSDVCRPTGSPACRSNADCDERLFCNGTETCVGGACQAGDNPCPGRFCRESDDRCVDCLVGSDCSDGLFCNGTETCSAASTCVLGIAPCPNRLCRESDDQCVLCLTNSDCNDGLFCNGVETCDAGACAPGVNACPDDGRFCNGIESCDESGDRCVSPGNPCELGETCNEDANECQPGCAMVCTRDADCANDQFCNGTEACINGCCVTGTAPCAPGQICCEDSDSCAQCCSNADCPAGRTCNRSTGQCQGNPPTCTGDSDCDDGLFCNGAEFCADDECHNCVSPCSEGQVCNETLDECSPNGAPGDKIHSAETVTGSIEIAVDTDAYTFTAQAGDIVVIRMSRETGSLLPRIKLFDPPPRAGSDPEASQGIFDVTPLQHQLAETGQYTIVVDDQFGDNTGDYSLSLVVISGPTISLQDRDGGEICSGQTLRGSIDPQADTDAYTFTAESGNTVVIRTRRETGSSFPGIKLFDPPPHAGSDPEASSSSFLIQHQLAETGQYTIVVDDRNGIDTGDYSLSLLIIP